MSSISTAEVKTPNLVLPETAQQRPQLKHTLMLAAGTQQLATCCAKKEPSHEADGPFPGETHICPETRLCTAQWAWFYVCECV